MSAPSSALSARIEVENAATHGTSVGWTVNRGANIAAHTQTTTSPVGGTTGTHRIVFRFYAEPDAQGDVVGTAAVTENIPSNGHINATVTVQSTIAAVEVPVGQVVTVPETKALDAVARDAGGNVIALMPGSFFFSVTEGQDCLSIQDGLAKGIKAGVATVTARADTITSPGTGVAVNPSGRFFQLGTLRTGDGRPQLSGVSGDGLTLVGQAFINSGGDFGNKPFRFTQAGGFQELEIGLTTPNTGAALRANNDGSMIVGYTPGDITVGWIWKNGVVTWIRPILSSPYTVAVDLSDDGEVVAGLVRNFGKDTAIRWRKNDSYDLLWTGEEVASSQATGLSSDGSVIVGVFARTSSPDKTHVMVQNGDNEPTEIPYPAGVESMYAFAVSADGRVVVGSATLTGGPTRPFRWSAETGTTVLNAGTIATTCNADGSIMIGNDGVSTFVWSLADGYQTLESFVLKQYGLQVPGDPKLGILISDTGLTLAGGVHPSEEFYEKPWVVFRGTN